MRILDENGKELQSYDNKKGYLTQERIFIAHHEATEAAEEQGHYEVIKEYANGGKEVEWVIDKAAVEAREAYDEYEDILRYTPYSEKELAAFTINELKQKLSDTDFRILKIVEGAATLTECAEIIRQRAEWRKKINELESTL